MLNVKGKKEKPSQEGCQLENQSPHRQTPLRVIKNCCEGSDFVMGLQLVLQVDDLYIGVL